MDSQENSEANSQNASDNNATDPVDALGASNNEEQDNGSNSNNIPIPDIDNMESALVNGNNSNDESSEELDLQMPNLESANGEPPGPPPLQARERRYFRRGLNLRPLNRRTIAAGLAGLLSIDNGGLDLDDDDDDTLDLDADDETSQNENNEANGESSDGLPRELELHEMGEVGPVLKLWEEKNSQENFDPIPYLTR